jgi:hypothetical protein
MASRNPGIIGYCFAEMDNGRPGQLQMTLICNMITKVYSESVCNKINMGKYICSIRLLLLYYKYINHVIVSCGVRDKIKE